MLAALGFMWLVVLRSLLKFIDHKVGVMKLAFNLMGQHVHICGSKDV